MAPRPPHHPLPPCRRHPFSSKHVPAFLFLGFLLSLLTPTFATFDVRDMARLERVTGPVVSPDGRWFAFTGRTWNAEHDKTATLLYIQSTGACTFRVHFLSLHLSCSLSGCCLFSHASCPTRTRSDDCGCALSCRMLPLLADSLPVSCLFCLCIRIFFRRISSLCTVDLILDFAHLIFFFSYEFFTSATIKLALLCLSTALSV